jgi:hypothetical protein
LETVEVSERLEDGRVVVDLLMLVLEAVVVVRLTVVVDFLGLETDTEPLDLSVIFLRVVGALVIRLVSEVILLPGLEYKDVLETLLAVLERPVGWVSIVETAVSTALQPIEASIIAKTKIHALIRFLLKNIVSSPVKYLFVMSSVYRPNCRRQS